MTNTCPPLAQRALVPTANNVRTYYRSPLFDRITGRYTVAWEDGDRIASIRIRNRLTDMEGHRPGLGAVKHLPATVRTYFEAKRRAVLKKPMPFLVYEAIEHLEAIVAEGTRIVELGGGNSTLWFLERGATVTTIEHSPEWANEILHEAWRRFGEGVKERLRVEIASGDDAITFANGLADRSFDLALVDCMNAYTWRRDGVEALRPKVRSGGELCLDNSDHPNNWAAVEVLGRDERTRFTGYAPMCPVVTQTSFWTVA